MTVGSDRMQWQILFLSNVECVFQRILINAREYLVAKFGLSHSALCTTGTQIYIKSNRHMFWLVYIMVIYNYL